MNPPEEIINIEKAVAFIRHELRTPINAIVGYGEMVQEDLEEEQSPLLSELDSLLLDTRELLNIINGLVKLSDDTAHDPKNLQKLFVTIVQSTSPAIEKIVCYANNLLNKIEEPTIKEDITKIRSAAIRLQGLVNNLDSIFSNFLESLSENEKISGTELSPQQGQPAEHSFKLDTFTQPPKNLSIGKILVVDDNSSNLDLLSRYLTRKGHTVTTSLSAKTALESLTAEDYDLILLDLIMPEMNGDKFLEFLKNSPEFQHIPIIMISALDEFASVIHCIEMGAEDFLPKPFDPTLLKARVDSSLEKKRLRDQEKIYTQQVEALSAMMAKELEKGRQIQKNFLPSNLPIKEGWEFSTFFSPARQLSGDFYDLFELPQDSVGIVVADVCDKGVGAALFMGLFRSLIRIFSGQAVLENQSNQSFNFEQSDNYHPLNAMALINDYVAKYHGDASMFATIFFGVLELPTGKLSYVNGGHEPTFIIDAQQTIKHILRPTGPAVGMLPNLNFKIQEVMLEPDDILVAYTDGVTEARSETTEFFGKEKLISVLQSPHPSTEALVTNVQTLLKQHIGSSDQFDDITLLAVKRMAAG